MIVAITIIFYLAVAAASLARASNGPHSVRAYAHRLVLQHWHSEAEWVALVHIVDRESAWNPCAHWYAKSECGYTGSNSCGLPQANPCPGPWRGRLYESRFEQVRWLVAYIASRYGSPSRAWAHWQAARSY